MPQSAEASSAPRLRWTFAPAGFPASNAQLKRPWRCWRPQAARARSTSRPWRIFRKKRGDTVHIDVIDREGNMVSVTPSGGWLQSSPTIPGLGFCLNSRAQMFWLEPGLPTFARPRQTTAHDADAVARAARGPADAGFRNAGRRPAGTVAAGLLPAPRPPRPQSSAGHRPAAVPHRAFPRLLLSAHARARQPDRRSQFRCRRARRSAPARPPADCRRSLDDRPHDCRAARRGRACCARLRRPA